MPISSGASTAPRSAASFVEPTKERNNDTQANSKGIDRVAVKRLRCMAKNLVATKEALHRKRQEHHSAAAEARHLRTQLEHSKREHSELREYMSDLKRGRDELARRQERAHRTASEAEKERMEMERKVLTLERHRDQDREQHSLGMQDLADQIRRLESVFRDTQEQSLMLADQVRKRDMDIANVKTQLSHSQNLHQFGGRSGGMSGSFTSHSAAGRSQMPQQQNRSRYSGGTNRCERIIQPSNLSENDSEIVSITDCEVNYTYDHRQAIDEQHHGSHSPSRSHSSPQRPESAEHWELQNKLKALDTVRDLSAAYNSLPPNSSIVGAPVEDHRLHPSAQPQRKPQRPYSSASVGRGSSGLRERYASLRTKYKELAEAYRNVTGTGQSYTQALLRKLQARDIRLQEATMEIDALVARVEDLHGMLMSHVATEAQRSEQIAVLKAELETLRGTAQIQAAKSQASLQGRITLLEETNRNLEQRCTQLLDRLTSAESDRALAYAKVADTERETGTLLQDLQRRSDSLRSEEDKYRETIGVLTSRLETTEEELTETRAQTAEALRRMEAEQARREAVVSQIDMLDSQLTAIEAWKRLVAVNTREGSSSSSTMHPLLAACFSSVGAVVEDLSQSEEYGSAWRSLRAQLHPSIDPKHGLGPEMANLSPLDRLKEVFRYFGAVFSLMQMFLRENNANFGTTQNANARVRTASSSQKRNTPAGNRSAGWEHRSWGPRTVAETMRTAQNEARHSPCGGGSSALSSAQSTPRQLAAHDSSNLRKVLTQRSSRHESLPSSPPKAAAQTPPPSALAGAATARAEATKAAGSTASSPSSLRSLDTMDRRVARVLREILKADQVTVLLKKIAPGHYELEEQTIYLAIDKDANGMPWLVPDAGLGMKSATESLWDYLRKLKELPPRIYSHK
eukprot:Clim_evm59s136 gene=Clim_evmTU59s136